MTNNRYVDVVITRQTQPVSQAGFGLSLILSDEKAVEYTEYRDPDAVGTDFGVGSETHKLAQRIFGQTPRPVKVAVHGTVAISGTELVAALTTLNQEHGDFFYLHCTDQTDETIKALANWINAHDKFYFASTSNKVLYETLQSQNTVLIVTETPEEYPAAAWVGHCSPQTIGSLTWTFKTLNGIIPDKYNESDLTTIEKGASAYIREGGVNITSKGVTTSGEYIDILQGQYFIKARMTEAIFGMLVRLPKVPFEFSGIAMTVSEVDGVLKRAAAQGIIAKDEAGVPLYSIDIPAMEDISTNDKAQRILPDIHWEATISRAVENVPITGVLKL